MGNQFCRGNIVRLNNNNNKININLRKLLNRQLINNLHKLIFFFLAVSCSKTRVDKEKLILVLDQSNYLSY